MLVISIVRFTNLAVKMYNKNMIQIFGVAIILFLLCVCCCCSCSKSTSQSSINRTSRGQLHTGAILKALFPRHTFVTVRPHWLKSPLTNRNLELDFYCEALKLAIEFNGQQHYQVVHKWHPRGEASLKEQQWRDQYKQRRCREVGVDLIVVSCYVRDVELFLRDHPMIRKRR